MKSVQLFVARSQLRWNHKRRRKMQKSAGKASLHSCTLTWTHADIAEHNSSSHRAGGEIAGNKGKARKTTYRCRATPPKTPYKSRSI